MIEIKNIHYLSKYPKIQKSLNKTVERIEEGEIQEAFFHLRNSMEGILIELARGTQWYKKRVIERENPSNDEIIKQLNFLNIINEKQTDLFNTIRKLGNKNVHYDNSHIQREFIDSETLRILCVRLDKELPSLMSNLGIGGASRLQYLNNDSKDIIKPVKNTSNTELLKRKYQNEIRDYINNPNSYKNNNSSFSEYFDTSSKPIQNYKDKPILLIKFILSLLILFILIPTIVNDKFHILENTHSAVENRLNILVNEYSQETWWSNGNIEDYIRAIIFDEFFEFVINIKDGKFNELFK